MYIQIGLGVLSLGVVVYMVRAWILREFPFAPTASNKT
jgi:hypothetical protein